MPTLVIAPKGLFGICCVLCGDTDHGYRGYSNSLGASYYSQFVCLSCMEKLNLATCERCGSFFHGDRFGNRLCPYCYRIEEAKYALRILAGEDW